MKHVEPDHFDIFAKQGPKGAYLQYWHVKLASGVRAGAVVRRRALLGTVKPHMLHVHISEYVPGCGLVDPARPRGLLADPYNTEWPSIGPLSAMAAGPRAWVPLTVGQAPGDVPDPARPVALDELSGTVDLRASVTDMPKVRMQRNPQMPLAPAAIRAYLAPVGNVHRHLFMRTIFDGSRLLPSGSPLWHYWAFGTYRQNALLLHGRRHLRHADGLARRRPARLQHDHRSQRAVQVLRRGAHHRGRRRPRLHPGQDRQPGQLGRHWKRRGRDSNPRTRKPPLRDFQSRSLSQLGHLSGPMQYAIRLPHASGFGIVGWIRHVPPATKRGTGMADERFETLRKVTLFEGLSDRELEAVAHAAKERRFDTGDTVVVEGEGGVGFFVVADGTARVEAHGTRLGTISQGASFGEVALLDDGGRRSATVVAESPLRVYGLTAWQFTPLLEEHPSIAVKIAKMLARRLREAEERAASARAN